MTEAEMAHAYRLKVARWLISEWVKAEPGRVQCPACGAAWEREDYNDPACPACGHLAESH